MPDIDVPAVPSVYALTDVKSIAFSPDGKMVVTGNLDGTVHLYEVASGKQLHVFLRGALGNVGSVSFSPDGKKVIAAVRRHVLLWDTDTGRELMRINIYDPPEQSYSNVFPAFTFVVFSPDRTKIITVSMDYLREYKEDSHREGTPINGSLQIWDAETGEKLQTLEGYGGMYAALSPDGKKIASSGFDGIVRIVDAESEKELHKLEGQIGSVSSITFSPDGKKIATGREDKTIRTLPGKPAVKGDGDNTIRIWTFE